MPINHLSIPLATGTLKLNLESGHIPISRLIGFAARISSQRKFLLVSKVLGKHYPVTPLMMTWSYRALAKAILEKGIIGTSLWLGMAETATGLGYGVFEAAWNRGQRNALFIQTTRYHLHDQPYLEFQEAHSHATDLFLYYPEDPKLLHDFLNSQTLVLIDDEISTGKTFLRLIKAYQQINPALQKVLIVSLVNFANVEDRQALHDTAGVELEWACLREGTLHFEDRHNTQLAAMTVNVSSNQDCKRHLLAWPGRLGIAEPILLEQNDLEALTQLLRPVKDDRPVLVLGTGECNAPAFLLGRKLSQQGVKVIVQSTTRSPIHVGNAIQRKEQFEDNYDDQIPNFIYNLFPGRYRDIIVCHETPLNQAILDRLTAWNAISARFEMTSLTPSHAKIHFSRP